MAYNHVTDHEDEDHYNDVFLTNKDIQNLSSSDELVRFFSRLHYQTDERIQQTLTSLNITSASLQHSIKCIERIALHNSIDLLSVYLFEFRSLNVTLRNDLVRQFRSFAGNALLILTTDYERLDFVLLERYVPTINLPDATLQEQPLPSFSPKQLNPGIRPHILQVERRVPGDVALRVLRRFTYTESDEVAQYEKLLNAYIIATWSEPYFNNRGLFSDYYLNQRFPELDEWKSTREISDLRRGYKVLRNLYEDARETYGKLSEVDICRTLLEPVLQALGFHAQRVQLANQRTIEAAPTPDYHLFSATTDPAQPSAVCLTYRWGRNLDGKDDTRDPERPENPAAIAVTVLDAGEAEWVIVTNGIVWRLYAAKAHSRATNYYEINLLETLELAPDQREKAFHYFWLFFREKAFVPTERIVAGELRSITLLDYLLIVSEQHARDLGERLKNRVFEEIFPYFAQGFVNHARQHKLLPSHLAALSDQEHQRLLEPYFAGTLTFLYRLLFLLYAESRDLLPLRQERGYYEYSLERLKAQIKAAAGDVQETVARKLETYSEQETDLYERLLVLFQAIDKGKPDLNVPIYNGGLFITNPPEFRVGEPEEIAVARFLTEHKIPNRWLALGIDRLARDVDEKYSRARQAAGEANEHSHSLIFIDYKSLGVRHLGSIYEGLLEFKLRIAPETMAVVEGKRTEEVLSYEEAKRTSRKILKIRQDGELKERYIARGTIYLENDRRERKATGSYYTPDYIVEYIVEQTIGPILKDKLEKLRPVFRNAQKELANQLDLAKSLGREDPDSFAKNETYKRLRTSLNEAFFDIKALDPAMGSGHFLVEAVDFITDKMARWLNGFAWNPIEHELEQTQIKIEKEMERQHVTVDMQKLTPLNLLKRRVLKSCIYGVDLNPMAVELARISLWLDCFTVGAPLSFLDHHIKYGNSLLGASVHAVHKNIKDNLFGYQFQYLLDAARMMRGVSQLSDITIEEVAESRAAYQQAHDALQPYKHLFDIWLSQYFGNEPAQSLIGQYAEAIVANDYSNVENKSDIPLIEKTRAAAEPIATDKRFLHWELEFPEVYFNETERKADGGFDAVIGNPPYVRQEGLGDAKTAFKKLYTVFDSIADLYTYFIELGHLQLRPNGRFSMITANKFMRANYGAALRKFLMTNVHLEKLIDFGELRVFEEAATDPLITVSSKELPSISIVYVQIKNLKFGSLNEVVATNAVVLQENAWKASSWSLTGSSHQVILDKMQKNMDRLGIYSNGKIRRGILTGYNEAFIIGNSTRERLISDDPNSADVIKPFLVGDDVRKYFSNFQDKYLIWTYIGVPIKKYPAIYRHLQQYQVQLEKRWDKGNHWWELRHCDYYTDFEKSKLIYPEIAMTSRFTLDEEGFYTNNKAFLIPGNNKYLLSLLNSQLIWFYLKTICSVLGDADEGGRLELRSIHVETTPIRRINFVTSEKDRAYYRDKAHLLYQQCLQEQGKPDCIMGFVNHHLAQEPEASDIVQDLLAYLAEEMLRLNKEKRTWQQEFLSYLTDVLHIREKDGKAGLDTFTGKTRLLDYPGDYQKGEASLSADELWDIIQKNRSRIITNPPATLKANIQTKYTANLAHIEPLKVQLKHTDELINQVVYRLYGLTEEEQALVEGRQ